MGGLGKKKSYEKRGAGRDPVVKTILALIFLSRGIGLVSCGRKDGWMDGMVVTWMEVVVVVVFVVGAGGVAVPTRRWILVVVTVRVHGDGGGRWALRGAWSWRFGVVTGIFLARTEFHLDSCGFELRIRNLVWACEL